MYTPAVDAGMARGQAEDVEAGSKPLCFSGSPILIQSAHWGPTEISAQLRYRGKVGSLRRRRQIADRHVLDHAAAEEG
jgi:hypothetical protein